MNVIQREIGDGASIQRHGAELAIDIHCHCLPGVDDGPATRVEALELCRALVADGIGTVIASPHQLGRYEGQNSGQSIRDAVESLVTELSARNIPLQVLPGAEVRLDERIPRLVRTGEALTLADSSWLLLEIPRESYIDPLPLIRWLAKDGVRTVVAHPERHKPVSRRLDVVRPWVDNGALLQINASSLLGDFGPEAEAAAWGLLACPLPLLIATDAHNANRRPPLFTRAAEQIRRRLGAETARRVCIEAPRLMLSAADQRGGRSIGNM